jgi:glycosyltransferase involved in cell wall biosynthesis
MSAPRTSAPAGQILTFTSLFPSTARPRHGLFVQDRMARVAAHSGLAWRVVCPLPGVPWPLRRPLDSVLAREPALEQVAGVSVHHVRYFHLPGLSLRVQARRVAAACLPVVREIASAAPTVLDAHYLYPDGVAAMRIAAALGLPCVVTARGSDLNVLAEVPAIRAQMQSAFAGATALLAVSDDLRRRFDAIVGPGRTRVSRNGVDLELFAPGDRGSARERLGLPLDRRLVLGVGRLVADKGFDLAAESMRSRTDGAMLVLAGEGPFAARIRQALGAERVRFLGSLPRERLADAYRACDVMVLPSSREGWPNVVAEALASGLPVVASSVGGIPEILQDREVGELVAPGDVAALGAAIDRFLRQPVNPAKPRLLAARYSWRETIEELTGLFRASLQ